MQKAKQTFIESARALCLPHYKLGHFTHCHMQCGRLHSPSSEVQYQLASNTLARYDLASLTKALVTSPLVFWSLSKEGKKLSCKIQDWLGSTHSKFSKKILEMPIMSLLSHRSGLPDWGCLWTVCLGDRSQSLCPRDRLFFRLNNFADSCSPSGAYVYSDLGFIILGLCLEEKYNLRLNDLFQELLSDMGLSESTLSFNRKHTEREQSIPVGFCPMRGRELAGEVHDENASVLSGEMGHAGLFGTLKDIADFLAALTEVDWGRWLINENRQQRSFGERMVGLSGWHQGSGDSSKPFKNGRSIGHLGFTGTAFWMDPDSYQYGILLTNRIIHARISPWITRFRSSIFSLMNNYLGSLH